MTPSKHLRVYALALLVTVAAGACGPSETSKTLARAAKASSPWDRFVALGADSMNPTMITFMGNSHDESEREWAAEAYVSLREALLEGDARARQHVFEKWGIHQVFRALREEVDPGYTARREQVDYVARVQRGSDRCRQACSPHRWSYDERIDRCRCGGDGTDGLLSNAEND